jgi:hypothetical protein
MTTPAVIPEIKKKESEPKLVEAKVERKPKPVVKRPAARKKAAKKSVKKAQQKVGRPSAKKVAKAASEKKTAAKRQRKPFPYARVLKMWRAEKSSMEIAKAIGRYDSKAADPMHSFRVTLTRFHRGVRINGKLLKLPHRVSKKALTLATKAGKKAAA